MKKKMLLLTVLLLLVAILPACSRQRGKTVSEYIQPFTFYFRTSDTEFSVSDGLIRAETRDLGEENYTDVELFKLYFAGPISDDLTALFPKGTELIDVSRSGSQLYISLRQTGDAPSAVDQSIAYACIAKTAFQLEEITQVHFRTESLGGQVLRDLVLTDSDLLLYDSGERSDATDLLLYFADSSGHLQVEKRVLPLIPPEQQPSYVIEQLLLEPSTPGLHSPLPQGTAVLDINLEFGVCSVDFNADFYNNRPLTERDEILALFSIVNSLCDLDNVDQVQIYVEGRRPDAYVFLDLTQPFSADPFVAASIREELNEFEGTLCLPGTAGGLLHRLPVRIRIKGGISKAEALLQTLFTHPDQNTLPNPTYGLSLESVSVFNRSCVVNLSGTQLTEASEEDRSAAIRCITASLACLPEVDRVLIRSDGIALTETEQQADASWFVNQEESLS